MSVINLPTLMLVRSFNEVSNLQYHIWRIIFTIRLNIDSQCSYIKIKSTKTFKHIKIIKKIVNKLGFSTQIEKLSTKFLEKKD